MNEMAMVEYLLRLYAKYDEWSDLQSVGLHTEPVD